MLLINIHHYIMGLAGSARAGGRGTRAAANGGSGGRIPGPACGRGWGERIPKWGPEKGRGAEWEEPDAQRGRVGGTAGRREEVWGRGGVWVNSFLPLPVDCGGAGALESPG